jgi:hypothetical protein
MSEERWLSIRTRQEMARGAKQVIASRAWDIADKHEQAFAAIWGATRISCNPYFDTQADSWFIVTRFYPNGGPGITLLGEPSEGYPSDTLMAQLTLLAG